MKLVYTHENITMVTHFQNVVEQAGIATVIKNQFSAGGAGDLAMGDVWPELWVLDDDQYNIASELVSQAQAPAAAKDWSCAVCGQENAGNFEICWQCQAEKPEVF